MERSRIPSTDAEISVVRARWAGFVLLPAAHLLVQVLGSGRCANDNLPVATAMAQGVLLLTADKRFVSAPRAHFAMRWLGALPDIVLARAVLPYGIVNPNALTVPSSGTAFPSFFVTTPNPPL
jgi:hypothetical protein